VEICKLRLFLKLAAQVEPDTSRENLGIEPLPDIDSTSAPVTPRRLCHQGEVQRCMKNLAAAR